MTRAWEIARKGAKKFGGKVKEYFTQALVMAWKEIKKMATDKIVIIADLDNMKQVIYGVKNGKNIHRNEFSKSESSKFVSAYNYLIKNHGLTTVEYYKQVNGIQTYGYTKEVR